MTTARRLIAATALLGIVGCQSPPPTAAPLNPTNERLVSVDVVNPQPSATARTTTQPATVHAYFEARIFAKTSGYVRELNVEIGQSVKQGDVLAVIDVPEMSKQREAKVAGVERLQADEQRMQSQLTIAQAREASFAAKLNQARADVSKADADLSAAQLDLDRAVDLVKQQAVADRLRDEAQKKYAAAAAGKVAVEAGVSSAEADLALAKAEVEAARAEITVAAAMTRVAASELEELDEWIKYATLTAPFDGVVTERNVEPGDLVRNAQASTAGESKPLLVIAQVDRVRVRVHVPERDTPLVSTEDIATVTLQSLPGKSFPGKVERLAGVLDERTRTMLVEIDLKNPEGELRPGMFGQATITLAPAAELVALPANAVRYDSDGMSYVYVLNEADEVEIVQVQTGYDNGLHIEIAKGLDAKARVVGPLIDRLKPGQKVKVES